MAKKSLSDQIWDNVTSNLTFEKLGIQTHSRFGITSQNFIKVNDLIRNCINEDIVGKVGVIFEIDNETFVSYKHYHNNKLIIFPIDKIKIIDYISNCCEGMFHLYMSEYISYLSLIVLFFCIVYRRSTVLVRT